MKNKENKIRLRVKYLLNNSKHKKLFNLIKNNLSFMFTIFISIGIYFFVDFTYGLIFSVDDFNPDDRIVLVEDSKIEASLVAMKKEEAKKEISVVDTEAYNNLKTTLTNYYSDRINKNIKRDLIADGENVCKLDYSIKNKSISISVCDDYVFKREVELALKSVPNYNGRIDFGNENISKISFDYRK